REQPIEQESSIQGEFTGDPINLSLKDADIRDVLGTFSKLTGVVIVFDPDVSASVTIDVQEMPWDQALDQILRSAGLTYSDEGGVISVGKEIAPPKLEGEFEGRPLYRYVEEGKITEPKRSDGPNPRYPEEARSEGINGVVVMEAVISEDGSVREVEVLRSNATALSEAAVEAVDQWTFEPATLEGIPVAVRYILTVKFKLQ
ncbi:MAG: TonB family protein, partial [Acidobacteriota bacterium]